MHDGKKPFISGEHGPFSERSNAHLHFFRNCVKSLLRGQSTKLWTTGPIVQLPRSSAQFGSYGGERSCPKEIALRIIID